MTPVQITLIAVAASVGTMIASSLLPTPACSQEYVRKEVSQLERDKAECELAAMQYQQGYIAIGSPGYVAGAAIGNALGEFIVQKQLFSKCMKLRGWEKVKPAKPASAKKRPGRDRSP